MATFTPDEEAEIELMLWEYDRDGRIAIENFFRREPELSLRISSRSERLIRGVDYEQGSWSERYSIRYRCRAVLRRLRHLRSPEQSRARAVRGAALDRAHHD